MNSISDRLPKEGEEHMHILWNGAADQRVCCVAWEVSEIYDGICYYECHQEDPETPGTYTVYRNRFREDNEKYLSQHPWPRRYIEAVDKYIEQLLEQS